MFLCDRCQQINFKLPSNTSTSDRQQQNLADGPESCDNFTSSSVPSAATSRTATFETARTSFTPDATDGLADAVENLRRTTNTGTELSRKASQEKCFVIYVLHETRESWRSSLEIGCRFCLLISSQLLRDELPRSSKRLRREDDDGRDEEEDVLGDNFMVLKRRWPALPEREGRFNGRHEDTEENKQHCEKLLGSADVHVRSRLGGARLQVIEDLPEDYKAIYQETSEDQTQQNTPGKRKDDGPSHQDHTGSPTNIKLARKWFEECQSKHSFCSTGMTKGHRTPYRLIDVSDPDRPFLLDLLAEQREEEIPYVALSYCWGHGERVLTKLANYKDHTQRIPTERLPRTFKEAFEVARELGFQYVWTDAFCMIQDDDEDMANGLPHMGDIYRYAVFTICAEGAPNAHAGLYQQRDSRIYQPCEIQLRTTGKNGIVLSTNVTLATKCERVDYLEPRGWVLQEEILACRRLLFGKQMRWRCIESVASEVRPLPREQRNPLRDGQATEEDKLRMWLYEAAKMRQGECDRARWFRWNHFDAWYSILDVYGRKKLTYASDVLNAVDGLATMFSKSHGSTYLYGLWEEDLQIGLSWYVCNNDSQPVQRCNDKWPSWSWASVGKVALRFPKCLSQAEHLEKEGATISSPPVDGSNYAAQRANLQIRSKVKSGLLCFDEASKGSLNIMKSRVKGERLRFPAGFYGNEGGSARLSHVALDEPSGGVNNDTTMDVICLLLHIQKAKGQHHSVGLILQMKRVSDAAYRRVGLAFFEPVTRLEDHPLWDSNTTTIKME